MCEEEKPEQPKGRLVKGADEKEKPKAPKGRILKENKDEEKPEEIEINEEEE